MSFQIKFIVFLAASAGLAWLTRKSLRQVRSHGFFRFFAWEAILALILLNIDVWFDQPFRGPQLISWPLLILSGYFVIHSFYSLHKLGKPDRNREDISLIGIEKTTELVTTGAYRYIRHPMYSSLLFLAWGAFFKDISWLSVGLVSAATSLLNLTARVEEAENNRFFGIAYRNYVKKTKMFIPFLF
jgi:protein-S-isoprenylcysteine O-methyltransferase Ste14